MRNKNIISSILFKLILAISILLCSFQVFAASNTWDFDLASNYTLSNQNSFTLASGLGRLSLNFNHVGSTTNAALNGAYDLVVEGNYAYMTSYLGDRFVVVDISVPTAPVIVGNLANNNGTLRLNGASGLVKNGNYIYIASRVSDAIQIIDVSTPTAPVAAGQLINSPTSNRLNGARAITLSGTKLYVTSDIDDALVVLDISNPVTPVKQGEYQDSTLLNGVRDVKISGNYAFVSSYNRDNLAVIDISNPLSPTFVTELRDRTNLNGAWGIKIIGSYVYLSAYLADAVQIIDISVPTTPTIVTTIDNSIGMTLSRPRDIAVSGDILYIAGFGSNNINAVDVSNPLSPVFINAIVDGGSTMLSGAYGVFKSGLNIYAASYTSDAIEIMSLNYATNSPYIIPNTAFSYAGDTLTGFSHVLSPSNTGTISYQISKDDGTTWYYWNGSSWLTTVSGVTNSNSAAIVNTNIASFDALPGGTSQFKWKAFFTSNGTQKTEINSITVDSYTPPVAGPGGVGANLQIWLKADSGPSTSIDGATVASWADQSGNGFDASGGVSPIYRNNATDSLNFNPVVDFNGSTQYLQNLNNGAYTDSYFMVVVPDNTVDGTLAGQVPFGFDCNSGTLSTGSCGLTFAGAVLGAFTAAINDEVITHAIGSSTSMRTAQIGAVSYQSGKPMLISSNDNSGSTALEIHEKGVQVDNYTVNTYQRLGAADYRLGMSADASYPFPYDGKIAEVINYNSGISAADRQKLESYLSLKYGMTLNSGTQNYTASDGITSMWSTAGAYIHDIFGIGRDDFSQLGQVKSKSINDDNIIVLEAIGEGTNSSPAFTDMSDLEFLTISNNDGGNTWSAVGSPSGYHILSRQWRVQETGEVGTLNLDFDVANPNFDVPVLSAGTNYYFIYDSDNDNSLSDETPQVMVNTSGNIWQVAGFNLNTTREFTIATQASSNNIPTDISLSNNVINENVPIGTNVGNFSTVDADPADTHTYSFVAGTGDNDNATFSLAGNILSINESPDYEIKNSYTVRIQTDDGNGGQFQEAFTININNIGETINSIIDFETPGKYTVTSGTWTRTTTNPQENLYSIESSNAGVNTQSCFEVTNTFPAVGTVEFQYNVSSEANSDYLRFYIDNVEQQNWSGTVPWTLYSKNNVASGFHQYKWCYIKDGGGAAGTDNAFIDYITFQNTAIDSTDPVISSTNFASGALLPGGNHNIIINYSDAESGIDTSSDTIALYKWNGSIWGADISATGFNLGSKIVTATQATYPTNNLTFGKYRFDFGISDNNGNSTSTSSVFYIDTPEINISTDTLDAGDISAGPVTFSADEIVITVKTVGAGFNVQLSKDTSFNDGGSNIIIDWDGLTGVGYDKIPYTSTNFNISSNPTIATQGSSINTDGLQNTYTYNIKIGTLIDVEQAAGNYTTNLSFYLILDY